MDYFKTQKNATQRDVSLFDFAISKNKKIKEKEEPKKKLQENMKCEMTKEEKNFIINKYMYEEETDSEEDENSIILNPLNVDSIISEHGVLDETAEDICLICFEDLKICLFLLFLIL